MTRRAEDVLSEFGYTDTSHFYERFNRAARLDAEDAYRRGVDDSIRTIGEAATAMGVVSLDDQVKVALIRLERLKEGNGNE